MPKPDPGKSSVRIRQVALAALLVLTTATARADDLTVIAWNVESGGAKAEVIAERIAKTDGCDIWGLSEVANGSWVEQFETAAEDGEDADFKSIFGTTGGGDRLAIIYDTSELELISQEELEDINIKGRVTSARNCRHSALE